MASIMFIVLFKPYQELLLLSLHNGIISHFHMLKFLIMDR